MFETEIERDLELLTEKLRKGRRTEMAETDIREVSEKLDRLTDVLLDNMSEIRRGKKRGRDRDDDDPESVREMRGGRRDPLEIQGVMFQINIRMRREGETMPAYILLPPVRDERELEKLADEVEREFRNAKIFRKEFQGGGGNGYRGGGYGGGYGRDNYYRGRDWDRDRRY